MALKDYSDEFRANAVALYESTEGATYKGITADLGVSRAACAGTSASSAQVTWNGLPSPPSSTTNPPWRSLNSCRPALRNTARMTSASWSRAVHIGRPPAPYPNPGLSS
ncbi:hypothetical protein AB0H88_16125 [Nonomuraea sp. NPDC050680]|uniref:hypothetical protein n=1 Tax=Nonomuraea sp. NPDC050680 TaxID=3154630 RepID=UPI003409270B